MASRTPSSLYEWTASEMALAVAAGTLTPNDLVESVLGRIAEVEPSVRAWSYLDADLVRAQAKQLTAEATAGALRGPLHGIPVGIKDEFHVRGMPTAMRAAGSGLEPSDSTAVARLRAAGAVIMGKLHMPLGDTCPPTRNPWNLEHTPGGTSSGSGAAVAARMVPVALAEQTAGSGLRPAAFCGVAGMKPSYGRISRFGCQPFSWSFDHAALIGLTMKDISLVLSVVAGPDPLDPTSLLDRPPNARLGDIAAPRIGLVSNFFPELTDPAMLDALRLAALRLEKAGARVRPVALPEEFAFTWHVHRLVGGAEGAAFRAGSYGNGRDGASQLKDTVSSLIPATYYLHAQRVRQWLYERIQVAFRDVDALLMAVAPGAAPRGLKSTGDPTLLRPWSCLGYPAITLNGGLSPDGLPLGLQFVGAPNQDHRLCEVGAWCEAVLGRLRPPTILEPGSDMDEDERPADARPASGARSLRR